MNCGQIYDEKGVTFDIPIQLDELKMEEAGSKLDIPKNLLDLAKLRFELHSVPGQSVIKVCLRKKLTAKLKSKS